MCWNEAKDQSRATPRGSHVGDRELRTHVGTK